MQGAAYKTTDTDGWVSYWTGMPTWDRCAQEWVDSEHALYLGGEPGKQRVSAEVASMSMEKVNND